LDIRAKNPFSDTVSHHPTLKKPFLAPLETRASRLISGLYSFLRTLVWDSIQTSMPGTFAFIPKPLTRAWTRLGSSNKYSRGTDWHVAPLGNFAKADTANLRRGRLRDRSHEHNRHTRRGFRQGINLLDSVIQNQIGRLVVAFGFTRCGLGERFFFKLSLGGFPFRLPPLAAFLLQLATQLLCLSPQALFFVAPCFLLFALIPGETLLD